MEEIKKLLKKDPKALAWCNASKNDARTNEIFDIVSYKYEEELADILERFITYHKLNNMIKIYAPLSAIFAVAVLDIIYLLFVKIHHVILCLMCSYVIWLFLWFFCYRSYSYFQNIEIVAIPGCLLVITHIIMLRCLSQPSFVIFTVFTSALMISMISLIMEKKGQLLRDQMDELERNIVRLHRRQIMGIVDKIMEKRIFED